MSVSPELQLRKSLLLDPAYNHAIGCKWLSNKTDDLTSSQKSTPCQIIIYCGSEQIKAPTREWNEMKRDERSLQWCYPTLNVMMSCNLEVFKGEQIPTSMILAERMQQWGGESNVDEGLSLISCGWESLVDRKSDTLGPRWRRRTIEAATVEIPSSCMRHFMTCFPSGQVDDAHALFGSVVLWNTIRT